MATSGSIDFKLWLDREFLSAIMRPATPTQAAQLRLDREFLSAPIVAMSGSIDFKLCLAREFLSATIRRASRLRRRRCGWTANSYRLQFPCRRGGTPRSCGWTANSYRLQSGEDGLQGNGVAAGPRIPIGYNCLGRFLVIRRVAAGPRIPIGYNRY